MRVTITDEELAAVADTTHVMRIQAELEFDGQPITLDEYVLCRGGVRKKLGEPARGGFTSNRSTVFIEVPSGGWLRFTAAFYLCGTFGHIWGDWPIEKSLVPPPNFVPEIVYSRAEPTVEFEEYFSGLNYEKPRRLQIVSPFQISIPNHPPTPEDVRKAEEQAANGRRLFAEYAETLSRNERRRGWMVTAHIVPEEYWSRDPAVSALVETLPTDQLSKFSTKYWEDKSKENPHWQLWILARCDNPVEGWRAHAAGSWGVLQRTGDRKGRLSTRTTVRSLCGNLIGLGRFMHPVDCTRTQCQIDYQTPGFRRLSYSAPSLQDRWWVTENAKVKIGGDLFYFTNSTLFYDPFRRLFVRMDKTPRVLGPE